METLGDYPGVPGLFVAAIFSGALSTLSSGFNSLSAITLQDIIKSYIKPDISEKAATLTVKCLGKLSVERDSSRNPIFTPS